MCENILLKLLDKYPDKPWYWGKCGLSYNTNITMDIVDKFPDKPWNWDRGGLSYNKGVTMDIVEKFPDKPWEWGRGGSHGLSSNKFNYKERIKFEVQDKAARIIQRGCENWLYKPVLIYGKNGIVPRLAMRSDLFI